MTAVVRGGHPDPRLAPVNAAAGAGDVCALTFDDGPNGADTLRLLDALRERDIRAVFCVVGDQIERDGGARILRRIASEGHTIANHSTSFADMGDWPAERVRTDLERTLQIIRGVLGEGHPVPYWRAPNGSWGVTGEVAIELGMQPLAVENHIGDWDEQDPDVLAERLRAVMTPGSMVLAHDGGGKRAGTVEAVVRVVDERLAQGWAFVAPER